VKRVSALGVEGTNTFTVKRTFGKIKTTVKRVHKARALRVKKLFGWKTPVKVRVDSAPDFDGTTSTGHSSGPQRSRTPGITSKEETTQKKKGKKREQNQTKFRKERGPFLGTGP
jgi:hypothetical protein